MSLSARITELETAKLTNGISAGLLARSKGTALRLEVETDRLLVQQLCSFSVLQETRSRLKPRLVGIVAPLTSCAWSRKSDRPEFFVNRSAATPITPVSPRQGCFGRRFSCGPE